MSIYKNTSKPYSGSIGDMLQMKDFDLLLKKINDSMQLATGCTEPAAIALNCATARKHTPGEIRKVDIVIDMGLLKNAMFVGIPGVSGRGVKLCAALGLVAGDPEDSLNVLSKINREHEKAAAGILPLITVSPKEDSEDLYIETHLTSDTETTRVITWKKHDRIILVEHPPFSSFTPEKENDTEWIKGYDLGDLLEFANSLPLEKLSSFEEGVSVNSKIAEKGLEAGFGRSLEQLNRQELWGDSLLQHIQMITGAASFARMSGVSLPVMIVTGSGNQGITLFLTVAAAAEKLGSAREKLLRALGLALGVNLLAKAYLGALSPICACGVASGLAASLGIVYLLDGTMSQMMGAACSMIGSIGGMICDGGKEGCAYKVAISAATAALSAMTAVSDFSVSGKDGILAEDFHELLGNVGYLAKIGMKDANRAILRIMEAKA